MQVKVYGTQGSLSQAAGAALVLAGTPTVEPVGTTVVARRRDGRGMVTAEWAMAIIAAVAIAGVLIAVVSDGAIQAALLTVVERVIRSILDAI